MRKRQGWNADRQGSSGARAGRDRHRARRESHGGEQDRRQGPVRPDAGRTCFPTTWSSTPLAPGRRRRCRSTPPRFGHLCDALSGASVRLLVVGGAGSLYVDAAHTRQVMDGPDFPDAFKPAGRQHGRGACGTARARRRKLDLRQPRRRLPRRRRAHRQVHPGRRRTDAQRTRRERPSATRTTPSPWWTRPKRAITRASASAWSEADAKAAASPVPSPAPPRPSPTLPQNRRRRQAPAPGLPP